MKGKAWLYAYGLIALLHGLSIFLHWDLLRFITKPLLMIFLLVYFLGLSGSSKNNRQWIIAALFFSWLGDIFLMNKGDDFFMAGLAAFLVAHLCYIVFFILVVLC